jgi:hypothetical protein
MHQKYGRQALEKHLQVTQVSNAILLALTSALNRAGQRRKHYCSVGRVDLDQLIENQVLSATGEVVETQRDSLLGGEASGWLRMLWVFVVLLLSTICGIFVFSISSNGGHSASISGR